MKATYTKFLYHHILIQTLINLGRATIDMSYPSFMCALINLYRDVYLLDVKLGDVNGVKFASSRIVASTPDTNLILP